MNFSRVSLHPKTLIVCSTLTLLSIILIDPVWGFYDSFMALLASGSLNNVLLQESYHLGLRGLIPLLNFLHTHLPSFPWMGIILLSSWLFVQTVFVYLLVNSLPHKQITILYIIFTWVLLLLFVFGFSYIEFSITGMGMLLPFTGIVIIYYSLKSSNYKKWLALVVSSIAIFIGFGMRIESGIGGLLVGSIFIVSKTHKIKDWLKVLWLPVLISVYHLVSYQMSVQQNIFFNKIEPLVFYVTDSKNKPAYKANDSIDSLKIEMVVSSCLIDSSVINYAFYSRLKEEKKHFEENLLFSPFEILLRIKNVVMPTLLSYKLLTTSVILIFVLCVYIVFKNAGTRQLARLLFFNFSLLLVICFLAYSMKMEGWHYVPLIQILALGNLLFTREYILSYVLKNNVSIVLTSLMLLILLLHFIKENSTNHFSINEKVAQQNQIEKRYEGKYLFYDVNTRELLDNYVFRLFNKRDNIYFYDLAQMVYLREYAQQLNNLCYCNSFLPTEFFSFLKKNSRVEYISTPQRVNLLERYMTIVRDYKLHFVMQQQVALKEVKHPQAMQKFGIYHLE